MTAFARQANADWQARKVLLSERTLPECQELHFLQMACEKLCKAHLYRAGSPPPDIQSSHGHTRTQLPVILREVYLRTGGNRRNEWVMLEMRRLAAEIALLHPQVDGGGARPDNCEYPWQDAQGTVQVPAAHRFPELNLAGSQAGHMLMKLLDIALEEAAGTLP